jgi:hypothetical protein
MLFNLQNYNEFQGGVRWHDYVALMVNEFPVLLVRRYDFGLHSAAASRTYVVQVLGLLVWQNITSCA